MPTRNDAIALLRSLGLTRGTERLDSGKVELVLAALKREGDSRAAEMRELVVEYLEEERPNFDETGKYTLDMMVEHIRALPLEQK